MTPINKSQFANQCGFSRQFIGKLLKQKPPVVDIVTHNGKEHIDLDGVNTQYFLSTRGASVKPPPEKEKKKQPKKTQDPKPAKKAIKKPTKPTIKPSKEEIQPPEIPSPTNKDSSVVHTPDETKQNNPSGNNGSPNHKDKHELDKDRIKETIEKLRIENNKNRGDYIPKNLVKKWAARIYSIDANQFKTLGIKVSPKISDVYNSANTAKTKQILELVDKKNDKGLKKEITKILNAGEPERVLELNRILEDGTMSVLGAVHRENEKFLKNIEKLKEK